MGREPIEQRFLCASTLESQDCGGLPSVHGAEPEPDAKPAGFSTPRLMGAGQIGGRELRARIRGAPTCGLHGQGRGGQRAWRVVGTGSVSDYVTYFGASPSHKVCQSRFLLCTQEDHKNLFVHHENYAACRTGLLQIFESVSGSVKGKPPSMWTDAVGGGQVQRGAQFFA